MFGVQKKFDAALQQWREYLSCSNTGCSMQGRVWKRVSRRSSNIQVHNARYCVPACFEQELQRRFRKLNSAPGVTPRAPHRMPLGLLMLSRGDIDGQQLRAAVARQQEEGAGRIGEWMQSMGFVGEQQVTAALGAQGCGETRPLRDHAAQSDQPRIAACPRGHAARKRIA